MKVTHKHPAPLLSAVIIISQAFSHLLPPKSPNGISVCGTNISQGLQFLNSTQDIGIVLEQTMWRARAVACWRSLRAPLVTWSGPKIISSATRPPMQTSRRASICLLLIDVSSLSGSCVTIPNATPRGVIVALWIGFAPAVLKATTACPLSWYAVSCKRFKRLPLSTCATKITC